MNGTGIVVIKGHEDVETSEGKALNGVSNIEDGHGLDSGNCTLQIELVTEPWGPLVMRLNFSKFYHFQWGSACWLVHIHPSLLNLEEPEIY